MHHDLTAECVQLGTLTQILQFQFNLAVQHPFLSFPTSILSRIALPNTRQVFEIGLAMCSPSAVGLLYRDYKMTTLPKHPKNEVRESRKALWRVE